MKMKVRLNDNAYMPVRAHETDAGLDIRTPVAVDVPARGSAIIDTGVAIEIPEGYAGFIKSKSGLNMKHNLVCEGVVDTGYTGTIRVKMYNLGDTDYHFEAGDKLTQLTVVRVSLEDCELVDELDDTERGAGGFGSTGR